MKMTERFVETPSGRVRVWEKGKGRRVGFFAGLGGLPAWLPFLDRLAEGRRVVAPSLPGFPGGAPADGLDTMLDWALAAGDAFDAAGLEGADLIGASVGGALAAEVAALWPGAIGKLALLAPYGFFDERAPVADVFAQPPGGMPRLLSNRPEDLKAHLATPAGVDPGDWEITGLRANVAAASIVWPLGDTRIGRRLRRIACPTLLLWGADDRVIPPSYADFFKNELGGKVASRTVANAGHRLEFDQPTATARAIARFLD